jgi:hypothetical protein
MCPVARVGPVDLQTHFSVLSGQEYTVPGMFIANTFDDQATAMPIAPAPRLRQDPISRHSRRTKAKHIGLRSRCSKAAPLR